MTGELVVVAHTADPPTDAEFEEYIDAVVRTQAAHPGRARGLVLTDGGGPTTAQRRSLVTRARLEEFPVAVISSSAAVRFIVSTFALFNPQIETFAVTDLAGAMRYLRLAPERLPDVLAVASDLRRELGASRVIDALGARR